MSLVPGQRIALVLGAGGARGLAHIGVIDALQAHGLKIVAIAGASMGALVGGIHAAGRLDAYRQWACGLERGDVLRLLDFAFGHPGLIRGQRVMDALRTLVGEHRIEKLPIAFTAVATDLMSQREVWIRRGPLFDGIRASIAIPMIFTPHRLEGRDLVDGGLLAPVPIAATRSELVDAVVAVDVNVSAAWSLRPIAGADDALAAAYGVDVSQQEPDSGDADEGTEALGLRQRMTQFWEGLRDTRESARPKERGVMDLMARSLETMQGRLSRIQLAMDAPDLLINIPRDACAFYEFWRAREMIELGREATRRALANGAMA